MDRPSIQRCDFPTVRRGYDPDAVDQHLRRIADEVESGRGGRPVAAEASARVQHILEAAETTADQLRAEAGDEAREHVHRVSTAARELLERLGAMHDELGAMMDRLREEAGRLSAELRSLERDVGEIAPPADAEPEYMELEPEPETDAERIAAARKAAAPTPEPAPEVEEPEPETDAERIAAAKKAKPETAAGKARAKKAAPAADDEEAARLVALDMALAGTPRDETEKYLAEHYELADPGAVLDDVYALAGS
jgi:DivIVA domain-containing protein